MVIIWDKRLIYNIIINVEFFLTTFFFSYREGLYLVYLFIFSKMILGTSFVILDLVLRRMKYPQIVLMVVSLCGSRLFRQIVKLFNVHILMLTAGK